MGHQAFAQLLGNYGEFVGAIAVVFTLGYLAVHIRQSNNLENAESIRTTTQNYVNAILQVDAPVFRKARVDFDGLSGDVQMKIHNYLIILFLIAQTEVKLSERGLGEVSDYPPVLASWTCAPGIKKWWSMVGPSFSADFHSYIEELRERGMGQAPIHESQPCAADYPSGVREIHRVEPQ
jgi:hypothetical protein